MIYNGSAYNFILNKTAAGANLNLTFSFDALPAAAVTVNLQYRDLGSSDTFTGAAGAPTSPRTWTIANGSYEYRVQIFFSDGSDTEVITFTAVSTLEPNLLYISELNPVIFYEVGKTNLPIYQTRHFEDFKFSERGAPWQTDADWCQVWQTTDIINLQFESTFDPIIVELIDSNNNAVITLASLIGLPNADYPNLFSFEVKMSLGNVESGCYKLRITAGSGDTQKIYESCCQEISSTPIENTIFIEYWNSRYHKDVIFETGIKFGYRTYGWINYDSLEKVRKDEFMREQKWQPALLNSKSTKLVTVHFNDETGTPVDEYNKIDNIFSCDNTYMDGNPFSLGEGQKFDFLREENYRKIGLNAKMEFGLNRNSRIFALNLDSAKKLVYGINADARIFGDTSNQGSSNTVPIEKVI